jgi:hypothetical protein
MTALIQIPHRAKLRAVLVKRSGTGWRVGIGSVLSGAFEADSTGYSNERQAETAALRLADAHDLMALQD